MQKSDSDKSKVDSASLIDLKAELFRKQEEFKAQKLQSQNTGFIKGKPSTSNKKPSLFSKKNVGVDKRAEKDYEEKVEEENVFERSRKALESKAKLYEKIASGADISEEDGSGVFLVDFQKKNIDEFERRLEKEKKEKEEMERREIEEEQKQLSEPVPPPESEEEEWVDYVDAFGRSRRCLRKDLPDLQQQDKTLQVKKRKMEEKAEKGLKDFQDLRDKSEELPSLLSADMKREIDREQWEKEEMEKMVEEKQGPIHYADVRHNEVRSHGVGFYQFDKDEEVRQEQMEQLNKLRQQTKDERSKSERIKEKRKAALAARLAKVKQRKREKLGLPDSPEDKNANSDEEFGPKPLEQEKKEPEPLTRDDSWRAATKSTREWDKGKQLTMERSEEVWLEKQRAEREEEFAPPSFYYDTHPSESISKRGKTKTAGSKTFTVTNSATKSFTKGSEIKSVVEKQLDEIRKNVESKTGQNVESIGNISQTGANNCIMQNFVEKDSTQLSQQPLMETVASEFTTSQTVPVSSTSQGTPFPDIYVQPTNFNVPPPNYQIPPPGFNIPHPNFNIPPPNSNSPLPNFNNPPPNFSIPPPNFNQPVPDNTNSAVQSTSMPNFTSAQGCSTMEDTKLGDPYITSQPEKPTVDQLGVSRQKFIPKVKIIDTRLMNSETD